MQQKDDKKVPPTHIHTQKEKNVSLDNGRKDRCIGERSRGGGRVALDMLHWGEHER